MEPPSHFVPEKKGFGSGSLRLGIPGHPQTCGSLIAAGIAGVNKEHFSVQVWISWKWELLSKASQPLLPFAWEVWGMNIDISDGFGINEHTAAIMTPKYPKTGWREGELSESSLFQLLFSEDQILHASLLPGEFPGFCKGLFWIL